MKTTELYLKERWGGGGVDMMNYHWITGEDDFVVTSEGSEV